MTWGLPTVADEIHNVALAWDCNILGRQMPQAEGYRQLTPKGALLQDSSPILDQGRLLRGAVLAELKRPDWARSSHANVAIDLM